MEQDRERTFWIDRGRRALGAGVILALMVQVIPQAASAVSGVTRVSVSSSGAEANGPSTRGRLSGSGDVVGFVSDASNLVSSDTNSVPDLFVRQGGVTERVSVSSSDVQASGHSDTGDEESFRLTPSLSDDGQAIAFSSSANNLVGEDTNNLADVFVHDLVAGTTTRVSVDSSGGQASGGSAPNAYTLGSSEASISGDARYVAFNSSASSLVSNDTNLRLDVFVHDRLTGDTERVSVSSSGVQGDDHSSTPSISDDGRYVAFHSKAGSLVAGDTNEHNDIFVHDRLTGATERVSVSGSGQQTTPSRALEGSTNAKISDDGRLVAFLSNAGGLGAPEGDRHVYVRFLDDQTTLRVSPLHAASVRSPGLSGNGRFVTFETHTALVSQDRNSGTDVYRYDLINDSLSRASVREDDDSQHHAYGNSMSDLGDLLVFESGASDVVAGDTNGFSDVFVTSSFARELPPLEDYAALGDSYSSGEGIPPYWPGTDTEANRCHRSFLAYPAFITDGESSVPIFMQASSGSGSMSFIACSSARTENVRTDGVAQPGEPGTQLQQGKVTSGTDLVTLTLGGNDAGFTQMLHACGLPQCTNPSYEPFDGMPFVDWVPAKIASIEDDLRETFSQIRSSGPNAVVVALGYPRIFSEEPEGPALCFTNDIYDLDERTFLNEMADYLNAIIHRAAANAGIDFVAVDEHFRGHEVCGPDGEWINGISPTVQIPGSIIAAQDKTFHPNESGQREYANPANVFLLAGRTGSFTPSVGSAATKGRPSRLSALGSLYVADSDRFVCNGKVATADTTIEGEGFAPDAPVEILIDGERSEDVQRIVARSNASGRLDRSLQVRVAHLEVLYITAVGHGSDERSLYLSTLVSATNPCR